MSAPLARVPCRAPPCPAAVAACRYQLLRRALRCAWLRSCLRPALACLGLPPIVGHPCCANKGYGCASLPSHGRRGASNRTAREKLCKPNELRRKIPWENPIRLESIPRRQGVFAHRRSFPLGVLLLIAFCVIDCIIWKPVSTLQGPVALRGESFYCWSQPCIRPPPHPPGHVWRGVEVRGTFHANMNTKVGGGRG